MVYSCEYRHLGSNPGQHFGIARDRGPTRGNTRLVWITSVGSGYLYIIPKKVLLVCIPLIWLEYQLRKINFLLNEFILNERKNIACLHSVNPVGVSVKKNYIFF